MGSPRNIKITAPADMELAEFYLRGQGRTMAGKDEKAS
jgi:2-C-methyl-D-erythritol 4-phosphate cytidylyltransferase